MSQNPAAAVTNTLTIRNIPFLKDIWQGGALAFLDKEVNGTKQGFLNLLGHVQPTSGGASMQSKVKSAEFVQAMATGVGVVAGEPISQIDPMIQVKLNAPSLATLAKLLFSSDATQANQAAVVADAQKLITSITLGVWYLLGVQAITKFVASKQAVAVFTDLDPTDYDLDTELGAVRFKSGGTNALAGGEGISCLYQAAALANQPSLAPYSAPQFTYGGVYIYMVIAPNEARANAEAWLRYMPRARIKPTGNFDISVDKPGEVTLDLMGVPSSEISGYPFGYMKQIAGTMRSIV